MNPPWTLSVALFFSILPSSPSRALQRYTPASPQSMLETTSWEVTRPSSTSTSIEYLSSTLVRFSPSFCHQMAT